MANEPPQLDPQHFLSTLESDEGGAAKTFVAGWPGLDEAQELFPDRLVRALTRAAEKTGSPSTINPSALSLALFAADGRLLFAEARFQDWLDVSALPVTVRAEDDRVWPRAFLAEERHGYYSPVILVRARDAPDWLWAHGLRDAPGAAGAAYICLAMRPSRASDLMDLACQAFGLTGLEARVTNALLQARKLPAAAARASVSYETAREAIASARAKAGAKSQSDLIAKVVALGAGAYGRQRDTASILIDCFGLSQRQADLALRIAEGFSRADAAKACGVSEHVTKQDLKKVYEVMGVTSATDLSLVIAETAALGHLAMATDIELQAVGESSHPLRLIARPSGGGQIALADYGPASGRPVLVTHSEANGRRLAEPLVAALHAAGLRPISMDRPGYGLSDPVPGPPFEAAAQDMAWVLDALGIPKALLLARSGDAPALTFGVLFPDRLEAGVLLNPRNPEPDHFPRASSVTTIMRLYNKRPNWVEPIVRIGLAAATPSFIAWSTREALKSSPADMALVDDPDLLDDYVRSVRLVAAGHVSGFIAEQLAYADGWTPAPLADGRNWTVVIGEQDPFWDYDASAQSWQTILPSHRLIRLADAGRFVHLSHTDLVARVLTETPHTF